MVYQSIKAYEKRMEDFQREKNLKLFLEGTENYQELDSKKEIPENDSESFRRYSKYSRIQQILSQ